WFEETGYPILFTKSLFTQLTLSSVFGLTFFAILYGNALLARRNARGSSRYYVETLLDFPQLELIRRSLRGILLAGSLVLSYLIGVWGGSQWDDYLRYQNAVPFGIVDPLFARDVGFYFFRLPFYRFLYDFALAAVVFSFLISLLVYVVERGVSL